MLNGVCTVGSMSGEVTEDNCITLLADIEMSVSCQHGQYHCQYQVSIMSVWCDVMYHIQYHGKYHVNIMVRT